MQGEGQSAFNEAEARTPRMPPHGTSNCVPKQFCPAFERYPKHRTAAGLASAGARFTMSNSHVTATSYDDSSDGGRFVVT